MLISLFDDVLRTSTDTRRRTETQFQCLNRSADPNVAWMRAVLEQWYAIFPESARPEIRTRIRNGGDRGFDSAFHELFLNALVSGLGGTCEAHPDLQDAGKHPDFLVAQPNAPAFFLEARVVSRTSDAKAGELRREGDLLDRVDQVWNERYVLQASVLRASPTPGSPKRLDKALQEWLASLDFDAVKTWWESDDDAREEPRFVYEETSGWAIEFVALPRPISQEDGEKTKTRTIAIEIGRAGEIDTFTPLNIALKEKAKRYGLVGQPYIIAVNSMDIFIDEDSIECALFGRKAANLIQTPQGLKAVCGRQPDGLWRSSAPDWALQVSGVLFTRKLSAGHSLSDSELRLYLNPWAKHPYDGLLKKFPIARLVADEYRKEPGQSITEVMALPDRPA